MSNEYPPPHHIPGLPGQKILNGQILKNEKGKIKDKSKNVLFSLTSRKGQTTFWQTVLKKAKWQTCHIQHNFKTGGSEGCAS